MKIIAGDLAEIGQFAFTYRKGATDNPWETRWLEPGPDMLVGFLWDVKPLIERVEVEFAPEQGAVPEPGELTVRLVSGGLAPTRVHPTHVVNWYARDKAALQLPMRLAGRQATERGATVFAYGFDPLDRPQSILFPGSIWAQQDRTGDEHPGHGSPGFLWARQDLPVQMASVHYRGRDPRVGVPTVRVYGLARWGQPRRMMNGETLTSM